MEKKYKILIFIIILILLFLAIFSFVEQYVYSKKNSSIITNIKNQYSSNENVIISGIANPNSQITIILDNKIGFIFADKKGKWIVNLGILSSGKHNFEIVFSDSENSKIIKTSPIFITDNIKNKQTAFILNSISKFFVAGLSSYNYPKELTTIPLSKPQIFNGKWQLVK